MSKRKKKKWGTFLSFDKRDRKIWLAKKIQDVLSSDVNKHDGVLMFENF